MTIHYPLSEFFLEARVPTLWGKPAKRFQNQNSVTDVAKFDKDAKKTNVTPKQTEAGGWPGIGGEASF
jgi:hypothetical protein